MADEPITTSIDALVKYLNEHGEVDSISLSASMRVSQHTIEEWANVLEKAGMIAISYKMGKMYLSPLLLSKGNVNIAKTTLQTKKVSLEADLGSQASALEAVNNRLDELGKFIVDAENAFKSKAGEVKKALDRIDALERDVNSKYNKIKERKDYIDKLSKGLGDELDNLQKRAINIEKFSLETGNAKILFEDINNRINSSEYRVKELLSNFDKSIAQYRKEILALTATVKDENKALADIAQQEEKRLREYENSARVYKRDAATMRKSLQREEVKTIDEMNKTKQEVDRLYEVAEKEVKNVTSTLETVKKQFGDLSNLSDKLKKMKNEVDEITKKRAKAAKEINILLQELKAVDIADQDKILANTKKLEKITESMGEVSGEVSGINGEVESVKSDVDNLAK